VKPPTLLPARHFVTVKAAVWDGDRLLLVREQAGVGRVAIDLPGGRLEVDESIEAGLRREIREELGVELSHVPALPIKLWTARTTDGIGVVGMLFEVALASHCFDHRGADEIVGAEFLSHAALLEARGSIHKPFIVDYFEQRRPSCGTSRSRGARPL
jgi:8-oxo-dGTP pyrophosphatase MutT (NUDIX family)